MMYKYANLRDKANALAVRERIIISITLMMILVALSDALFIKNFSNRATVLQHELTEFELKIETHQQKIIDLNNIEMIDLDKELKNNLEKESIRATQLDRKLLIIKNKLVSPNEMLPLLGSVLGEKNGLDLVSMSTLAPIEINNGIKNSTIKLYKHQLRLDFIGNYEQVRQYVKSLENLNRKVFLDQLLFKTVEYPEGQFTLKVHTLTTGEALIGA